MPLVPGPFRRGDAANVIVETPGYNFTDDAVGLQGDLAAATSDWQTVIDFLTAAADASGDVALGIDLGGILSLTDVSARAVRPGGASTLAEAYAEADAALAAAIAFAPNQAWTDPGSPYVPPDDKLTLQVPSIPPSDFVAAPTITVGTGSGYPPSVRLTNLTRYGAANFVVGDQFQVQVVADPGAEVIAQATFNGEDLGSSDWGTVQGDGQLLITGTMAPQNVGAWSEQWYVGGALLASFNFIVTAS